MKLKIKALNEFVREYFCDLEKSANETTDSGLDLPVYEDIVVPAKKLGHTINLGVKIEPEKNNGGYYLYPRSSISKTSLRMSNSVGIIDEGYRGEIMAKVDNLSDKDYVVTKGTRLFQICSPDLKSIQYTLVESIDEDTLRGEGGFGSTGK